jgi:acetyl-CoA carboxylase biotin carboxylase subunit
MTKIHQKIGKILIANRGEIALRVIRACRELGIRTVAVFSDVDRTALHVLHADEAWPLGGSTPRESYLDQQKVIDIARRTSVDAIHPGYGFLAENPDFAELVENTGIRFIGPSARAIRAMGDKTQARKVAQRLGVPTVSGTIEPVHDPLEGIEICKHIGFPVLLKATAGGGGKGMRVVRAEDEFQAAFRTAQSEAKTAFGDDRIYIEKYLTGPRHIETQIIGDTHGNVVYLGERECSIQRRHQKVIEESPSPAVNDHLRQELGEAAVRLAKESGYANAGTMEFLLDNEGKFYFLEMNTRLQVEHPITEEITGIDIVKQQIRIAEGGELPYRQKDILRRGHSIECRICAEDPENGFMPSTGTLERYDLPQGKIRLENGFQKGDQISVFYDSLMAKVIVWGNHRREAIDAMRRGLAEFRVEGVKTTIPFCDYVLGHSVFIEGDYNTSFIDKHFDPASLSQISDDEQVAAALCATLLTRMNGTIANHKSVNQPSKWRATRTETYRS